MALEESARITGSGGSESRHWQARLIAPETDKGQGTQACFVARVFSLDTVSEDTILHVSAQGLYRAFVNGVRVGSDLLTPGLTCYDDRIAYQSYDVSAALHPGENRIEIWLADGWFRSQILWPRNAIFNCWGDRIAAIAELVSNGTTLIATDETWKSGLLPVTCSGIYYGEDYDARLDALSESGGVDVLDAPSYRLVAQETAPVRELAPLVPVDTWRDGDREIFDFGQNCAAIVRLRVRGPAGATVIVEHAEILGPERVWDNQNYRAARAEAHYTLKGDGEETYQPLFTFMGFRYARVTVSDGVELIAIHSVPVSSVPEEKAGFVCDVPEVNRLVLNTIWSQRSNFIEIPTDCPQRDERLGWTGDAQVFSGTACWLADVEDFLKKYMRDVRHDQRPNGAISHFSPDPTFLHPEVMSGDWAGSTGWGDCITIIPWQLYLHYGDKGVLEENFPAMLRWLDHLWSISDGPIIYPSAKWGEVGFTFGDWLQPVGDNRKPRPTIADDCAATLYHFISNDLACRIARIIGDDREAERLGARAETIRAAFVREYFSASGRLAHNDQTSYALAFLYDLVPDEFIEPARGYFRKVIEDADYLIGTGFIGTPALLPALTKIGLNDVAEKVFLNRKVPGWLYQVENGATSIWERWDAVGPDGTLYDPLMNSYNHYAYGAVCQWLFESVAGISPIEEAPGFDHVKLDPTILPGLGHVEMWHTCRHGRLSAGWKIEDKRAIYTVTLPEGVEATMSVAQRTGVTLDGASHASNEEPLVLRAGQHEIGFDFIG